MTAGSSLIDVVETAYQLQPSDEEWLRSLLHRLQPLLNAKRGVSGFFFDTRQPGQALRFTRPVVVDGPRGAGLALSAALTLLPKPMVDQAFKTPATIASASQSFGLGPALDQHPLVRRFGHPFGFHDMVGFKVHDSTGDGLLVIAAQSQVTSVPAREASPWSLCAAHVGAALRLRRALTQGALPAPEAVLETNGATAHAEPPAHSADARSALRAAVLARERALGPLRRKGPHQALELWQALVAGRWSLVEHFDTDGHRYLIARKNDPAVRDPRGLSLRERQVVAYLALGHSRKLTGYELGLAPSTVTKHLSSAMRKLGARTFAELLQTVSAAQRASQPSQRVG